MKGMKSMGLLGISSLMVLGGVYLIVAVIWWLLQIAANWKIFTKAGEAGWKSIIPVYSDYVSYRIAWKTSFFWLSLVLGIVASVAQGLADPNSDNLMILAVVSLLRIVIGIIGILYSVNLAKAFGKGIGFAIGLIFLSPIFMLILGFGDAEYCGTDQ